MYFYIFAKTQFSKKVTQFIPKVAFLLLITTLHWYRSSQMKVHVGRWEWIPRNFHRSSNVGISIVGKVGPICHNRLGKNFFLWVEFKSFRCSTWRQVTTNKLESVPVEYIGELDSVANFVPTIFELWTPSLLAKWGDVIKMIQPNGHSIVMN